MKRTYDEDLFETSKMTFGEHLEELRTALIKSIIALVVGFLIGLMVAGYVVDWLQSPIRASLENYYQIRETENVRKMILESIARGDASADRFGGFADLSQSEQEKQIKEFMQQVRMLPHTSYIDPGQLVSVLKKHFGEDAIDVKLPTAVQPAPAGAAAAEETEPAAEGAKVPAAAAKAAADADQATDKMPVGGAKAPNLSALMRRESMLEITLWQPIEDDARVMVRSLNAQEAFMIYIKAAFVTGAVLAAPAVFWFIWSFIAAGLYPHEKSYVYKFLPLAITLFVAGAALAFFCVFRYVLDFLFTFNAWMHIDPDPRISEWMSFALLLPLGFGVSFQLPLVMMLLERIGIMSVQTYISKWRISILAICVIAMVLTPSDPMSMMFMATPLCVLYFFGIGLCLYKPHRKSAFDQPID